MTEGRPGINRERITLVGRQRLQKSSQVHVRITPKDVRPVNTFRCPLESGAVLNPDMDIKARRVERLRSLNKSARELADLRIGGYSYWKGMLEGVRPFGEKKARELEQALQKPPGWFDQDGEQPDRLAELLARIETLPAYSREAQLLARDLDTITDERQRRRAYNAAIRAIEWVRTGRPTPTSFEPTQEPAETQRTPAADDPSRPSRSSKRQPAR